MKTLTYRSLVGIFCCSLFLFSCNQGVKSSSESKVSSINENHIEAYYFHFERRCATCNAVEDICSKAVEQFNDSTITFTSVNLEEDAGKAIGNRLNINAQALIFVKDSILIDLTNDAFLLAGSEPERLKEKIISEIEALKNK